MHDQAQKLRSLVSRLTPAVDSSSGARRVVLSGCKGGVGTTTLAVNLAVAAKRHVDRVLLIDANTMRGDVARLLRLQSRRDLDDVLLGRCSLREAILNGPADIRVIPRSGDGTQRMDQRLRKLDRHLQRISSRFDLVVIDAGCNPSTAELLWPFADHGIVVTTTDAVAVMDAYALLKMLAGKNGLAAKIGSIVNLSHQDALAQDIQRRLVDSCQKFLRLALEPLGTLPVDMHCRDSAAAGKPVVAWPSGTPSGTALEQIAAQIVPSRLVQAEGGVSSGSLNIAGVN